MLVDIYSYDCFCPISSVNFTLTNWKNQQRSLTSSASGDKLSELMIPCRSAEATLHVWILPESNKITPTHLTYKRMSRRAEKKKLMYSVPLGQIPHLISHISQPEISTEWNPFNRSQPFQGHSVRNLPSPRRPSKIRKCCRMQGSSGLRSGAA